LRSGTPVSGYEKGTVAGAPFEWCVRPVLDDGTLDEETGEYIGDSNLELYGTESPGFPRSLERERRTGKKAHEEGYYNDGKTKCDMCNKTFKTNASLAQHCWDKHGRGKIN